MAIEYAVFDEEGLVLRSLSWDEADALAAKLRAGGVDATASEVCPDHDEPAATCEECSP